jgi:hypothetical protein
MKIGALLVRGELGVPCAGTVPLVFDRLRISDDDV